MTGDVAIWRRGGHEGLLMRLRLSDISDNSIDELRRTESTVAAAAAAVASLFLASVVAGRPLVARVSE